MDSSTTNSHYYYNNNNKAFKSQTISHYIQKIITEKHISKDKIAADNKLMTINKLMTMEYVRHNLLLISHSLLLQQSWHLVSSAVQSLLL